MEYSLYRVSLDDWFLCQLPDLKDSAELRTLCGGTLRNALTNILNGAPFTGKVPPFFLSASKGIRASVQSRRGSCISLRIIACGNIQK